MPRKGENIYKRKDGRWEGRYIKTRTRDGKAVYGYVYAHSYLEVKNKLSSAKASNASLSAESKKQNQQNTILFGDLACLWMNTVKPRVKESTYIKYRNSLTNYILPTYRKVDLASISSIDLESYASELLCSGGAAGTGLSAKTVNDTTAIIRSIFRFGLKNGYHIDCSTDDMYIKQTTKKLTVSLRRNRKNYRIILSSIQTTLIWAY